MKTLKEELDVVSEKILEEMDADSNLDEYKDIDASAFAYLNLSKLIVASIEKYHDWILENYDIKPKN